MNQSKIFLWGLAFSFLLKALNCYSQTPTIQWQRSYGGSAIDYVNEIKQTSDGGFISIGYTISNDGDITGYHGPPLYDCWVVKTDLNGNIQWQKCYGGTGNESGFSIEQTLDGGYIMAGIADSANGDVGPVHGDNDYWIIKTDASGTIQWQKCYGGTKSDVANCVQQTDDGGFVVAGYANSNDGDVSGNHQIGFTKDYWILKLDTAGTIQWQKCFGSGNNDVANSIKQTIDKGYIIAGYSTANGGNVTGNHGGEDYWVVKLDSMGTLLWQKCLGGTGTDVATSIEETSEGDYIVTGRVLSYDGDVVGNHLVGVSYAFDYWTVKLSNTGNIKWKKCYGGTGTEEATSIHNSSDGGSIIAGYATSTDADVTGLHGGWDYWLVKIDSSGNLQWQKCLGGSSNDDASCVRQTADGGYVIAGVSNSTDGDVTGNHGNIDYWVVKLENPSWISELLNENDFLIYPNPANTKINIAFENLAGTVELKIIDLVGRTVIVKNINERSSVCDITELQNGIYFIQINATKGYITKKFIKN
jgi:hypothetical protein